MKMSFLEFERVQTEFKWSYDKLRMNFNNLLKTYNTRPKFKLQISDNFELQLLVPPSFHKKHGNTFADMLESVYHDSSFYRICKNSNDFSYPFYERMYCDETTQYIMWEFDKDIYGSSYNLLSSYEILSKGIFYFLHPDHYPKNKGTLNVSMSIPKRALV